MMDDDADEEDGIHIRRISRNATIAASLCQLDITQLNTPFLNQPDQVRHRNITFETFSNQKLIEMMGFNSIDARTVHAALHIPQHFTLNAGRHAFRVSGRPHC